MEQKKTIFDYLGQFFATYGIIVTIFIVFTSLLGEEARELSSLFSLGSRGLQIATLCQLLLMAFIITFAQVIFLTDKWIKTMQMIIRNLLFFGTVCITISAFSIFCKWFPINNAKAWIGFGISFTICTGIGVIISRLKENAENKQMEQALKKIKEE